MPDPTPREQLIGLLGYIRELEKLKKSAPFMVPDDLFCQFQESLQGLPGIQYNLVQAGDDVWMRVARLQEYLPPEAEASLKPWLTLSKSPEKLPELRDEIVVGKAPNEERLKRADFPGLAKLFDRYLLERWHPWSAAEKPRRRTISIYNKLFTLQQIMSGESAEQPVELVWGIGVALWKHPGGRTVRHPLLTQACEISLDTATLDLNIRPRETDCVLESDCYAELEIGGVTALQAFFKAHQANAASRPSPFDTSSFEDVLKAAVGHFDPSGRFVQTGAEAKLPATTDMLAVTDSWVLYGRPRSGHIFLEDVERLLKNLKSPDVEVPPALVKFVTRGDSEVRARPTISFRGLSSSSSGADVRELYFPLPHNDEQKRIVELLETGDGVVVQGPPGTGKTHTIANIICHFLAQGKRVLVTSKGEQALSVLQEKIPADVRALTVALLSSEREGMEQFEHSIAKIGTEVANLNPVQKETEIARAEARLNQLHGKIAALDQDIARLAGQQMRQVRFAGREIQPEELARLVMDQVDQHGWLTDPVPVGSEPGFDNHDIAELRQARNRVATDIGYLNLVLPAADSLPIEADLLALHRDLIRAQAIEDKVESGQLLNLVDTTTDTFERARVLLDSVKAAQAMRAEIQAANQPWSVPLCNRLRAANDPLAAAVLAAGEDVRAEEVERRSRLARPVDAPAGAELDEDVIGALERLAEGKSAFALPFGKKEARATVAAVTVAGLKPVSADDWRRVQSELEHRRRIRSLVSAWNAVAVECGMTTVEGVGADAFRCAVQFAEHLEKVRRLVRDIEPPFAELVTRVFGRTVADTLKREDEDAAIAAVAESLAQHIDMGRLAYAQRRVREQMEKLEGMGGPVVDALRTLLTRELGRNAVTELDLAEQWRGLKAELKRLAALRNDLVVIDRVTALIESSGAPNWARQLRTKATNGETDALMPASWLEAWRWRSAKTLLDSLDGHHVLRTLFEKRQSAEGDLGRTYRDLVAAKTWLGVFHNSPDEVRQALAAYLTAMQSIGAGTGVRAIRHRRNARAAMQRAYKAVPCWILPQWRVSETLPPEIGKFDLVVVDEASQADMWALPALLRAKKLLIVGDHKQVSPSAVGIAERKILEVFERFLKDQPNGALMTPDRSIYDLAKVVFAGNSVMLREHFRCVPAIIEFSNRFYNHEIKPLRVPKRSERLDPPLIDVFVKGGYRKRDVNEPEARAILAEIQSILDDVNMVGRSIGVVTLLGQEQAPFIDGLIHKHIDAKQILDRQIRVGNPTVFQGDERDIMLMSMVLEKGNHGVPNRLEFEQRFNVAASRARDRMILFRSVEEGDVTLDGLNAQLIAHFRQPFKHDAHSVASLRELCESDFEREVFDLLISRNYRIRPQVRVGGYRIDLVVEGAEDRRLAVECDGDRYHGPDRWSDDMARQRILERAGWTFWRCFASSLVLHRKQVTDDLFLTLERMGIEPLGSESVDSTAWVAHRVVDPLGIDEDDDDEVPLVPAARN